jgi:hypothetical protein
MAAVAPLPDADRAEPAPAATTLSVVADVEIEEIQVDAERSLWRDAFVGIALGSAICAGLWALFMLIALAGTGARLGPAMWMGAGVGIFAGAFYGGWVGTMVGVRKLEHAEHETLPHAR